MRIFSCRRRFLWKVAIIVGIIYTFFHLYNNWPDDQLALTPQPIFMVHHVTNARPIGGNSDSERLVINGIEVIRDVNYEFEESIKQDEDNVDPGLGEDGVPVTQIDGVRSSDIDLCIKTEAFNRILSDKISLTRRVPDARNPLCANVKYDDELPSASVVIIFNNEAWSTLMRTIHSTIIRSPQKFLKEIILIDDASDKVELQGKLDYYIQTRLPEIVKLTRLPKRSGLIKARLAGARVVTGDVIVFLDAHCEVGINWLEPMLMRIKYKKDAVVMPIIDVIDPKHFGYMYNHNTEDFQIGGFTWSGYFIWIPIPEREKQRRGSSIAPTRSPTMAGGLLAIDRDYFWKLGSYDAEMEIWGGENLEMSFRIWQCGGTLEIHPCSRVGHIFRPFHPYTFDGKKDTHGFNTVRMAEVWMDDYKRFFYLHRPDLRTLDYGDLSDRITLRKHLGCRDFSWFLKNIYPEKFILDEQSTLYGRVRAKKRHLCFDTLQKGEDRPYNLGVYYCHQSLAASQYFALSIKNELRRESTCAEVRGNNVTMTKCSGEDKQLWVYKDEGGYLQNVETGLCITYFGLHSNEELIAMKCDSNSREYFHWEWEYRRQENGHVKNNF